MHGKRSKLAQNIIHHLCTILTCAVKEGMLHSSFTCKENVKYVLSCAERAGFVFIFSVEFSDRYNVGECEVCNKTAC